MLKRRNEFLWRRFEFHCRLLINLWCCGCLLLYDVVVGRFEDPIPLKKKRIQCQVLVYHTYICWQHNRAKSDCAKKGAIWPNIVDCMIHSQPTLWAAAPRLFCRPINLLMLDQEWDGSSTSLAEWRHWLGAQAPHGGQQGGGGCVASTEGGPQGSIATLEEGALSESMTHPNLRTDQSQRSRAAEASGSQPTTTKGHLMTLLSAPKNWWCCYRDH